MRKQLKTMTLSNKTLRFRLLNLGSRILELSAQSSEGMWRNLVLEYDQIESYVDDPFYLNALIGPIAGRLDQANYTIDNESFIFDSNDTTSSLHAGRDGLHTLYFDLEQDGNTIKARAIDRWNTHYLILYTLHDTGLEITMHAIPDRVCHLNLTQHTYFNLNGDSSIRDHALHINSDHLYYLDKQSLPIYPNYDHEGPFDFHELRQIGDALSQKHAQFETTKHIDHPYHTLNKPVVLHEDKFGFTLEVSADTPYTVVYLGNYLGTRDAKLSNGRILRDYSGIALEPQTLPNQIRSNPNDTLLFGPDKPFKRTLYYRIRTQDTPLP